MDDHLKQLIVTLLNDARQDIVRCLNVGEPPAHVALLRAALQSDINRIDAAVLLILGDDA